MMIDPDRDRDRVERLALPLMHRAFDAKGAGGPSEPEARASDGDARGMIEV